MSEDFFTDEEREAFWEELAEELHVLPMQPDEFTRRILAVRLKVSYATAERYLKVMEDEGRVTARSTVVDGRRTKVYRLRGGT